jgi:hypothetical protein
VDARGDADSGAYARPYAHARAFACPYASGYSDPGSYAGYAYAGGNANPGVDANADSGGNTCIGACGVAYADGRGKPRGQAAKAG